MTCPWEINTSHRISGLDQCGSVFKLRENGGCFSAGRSRVAVMRPRGLSAKHNYRIKIKKEGALLGRPLFYIFRIISFPNSEHFSFVAPSINLSKS